MFHSVYFYQVAVVAWVHDCNLQCLLQVRDVDHHARLWVDLEAEPDRKKQEVLIYQGHKEFINKNGKWYLSAKSVILSLLHNPTSHPV